MKTYAATIIGLKLQPLGFKNNSFEIEVTGTRAPTVSELKDVAEAAHANWQFFPGPQHGLDQHFSHHRKGNVCVYSLHAVCLFQMAEKTAEFDLAAGVEADTFDEAGAFDDVALA